MSISRTSALLAFAIAPIPAGDVLVVDQSGGGDYAEIQPAVDAAGAGDTILVEPGAYGPVTFGGKGLAIVADGPGVTIAGGIEIRSTLVQHEILLVGLEVHGKRTSEANGGIDRPALGLALVRGPLRAEHCRFVGDTSPNNCEWCLPFDCAAGDAVRIDAALDAAFASCEILGGLGDVPTWCGHDDNAGGHGVVIAQGKVSFHDCVLRGGDGSDDSGCTHVDQGGHGGDGIHATSPPYAVELYLSGSECRGGDGGLGSCCIDNGYGGDGIQIYGASSVVRLLDTALGGGAGLCGYPSGLPLRLGGGATASFLAGSARGLAAPNPMREGEPAALRFIGEPGDAVWLLVAAEAAWSYRPPFSGVLLLDSSLAASSSFAGVVPASGVLSVLLPTEQLPAGIESAVLYTQGLFRAANGSVWLSGPWTRLTLDQSF